MYYPERLMMPSTELSVVRLLGYDADYNNIMIGNLSFILIRIDVDFVHGTSRIKLHYTHVRTLAQPVCADDFILSTPYGLTLEQAGLFLKQTLDSIMGVIK